MKIFFPQWQGAGSGSIIEEGATALLNYLGKDNFLELALSNRNIKSTILRRWWHN